MDKEQEEMQFLGLFGIYKESYKMIIAWRKIFTKITLSLILPLSFIFLIHIEISDVLFRKIMHNSQEMIETPQGTPQYNKLSDMVSSEWVTFFLFKIVYFTFLLIFSLLSTSAVVYTVASIYTSREVTFKKVMSVVPKVWKRLMLASVVSVLEESYGFQAMKKSKDLIKGKMWLSVIIFLMLNISFFLVQFLFKNFVVHGWRVSSLDRTAYGLLCFLLLSHLFLFGLVIQTVLYFVCKSYHHQNIDKSALSDHLEVYLGEYEPLTAKDVQLEQYQV
ncbi:hypothetical protein AAHE18_08G044000 [Arachis hypogaea]